MLATLYYSTNGFAWEDSDGWLTDGDECEWFNEADGRFCVNGTVTDFDLLENNLAGAIPVELALLSASVGMYM